MKTALCIIVEGDSKLEDLKIAIESALPFVDYAYITTNGKEIEKTKEYLQSLGKNVFHSHLDWKDDFSQQRNFNLSQISKDVDYVLLLDSDDELVGGENLQKLIDLSRRKEFDEVFLSYWYGCEFSGEDKRYENLKKVEFYHQREKLVRIGKFYWAGRVHETPVTFDGSDIKHTNLHHLPQDPNPLIPIAVLHRKATRDSFEENEARQKRNRRLLELQLEDERNRKHLDPRTILYLMKIYVESDDRETLIECISLGEEYLELSGWDEERSTAYMLVSNCFLRLGQPERAKQTLLGALDEWPHNKDIYLGLANVSYVMEKYKDMRLYMDLADSVKLDKSTSGNRNLLDLDFKTEILNLRYHLNVSKDLEKAEKAAKKIYEMEPFPENKDQLDLVSDLKLYSDACRNIDHFVQYLADAKMYQDVKNILEVFPIKFRELPFYYKLRNKYAEPKTWGKMEVCYYASFGGPHFEKWDPTSLKDGIGGSETAVIKLAKEWASMGYKVTVYGDPKKEGIYDGVRYLSYTKFNPKDRFNIFIQWRAGFLANKIVSKKFLVDLHDVWSEKDYLEHLNNIDAFIVKSKYHRDLAPNIPDNKFVIISNPL